MNAEEIYELGKKNPTKELFNELVKKDKDGEWIYYAGFDWPKFDYDKGFNALIQKDKTGGWIYWAGRDWKKFDYEKGTDALLKRSKKGELIYWAGLNWPKFNYEKGLDALIKRDKTGGLIYSTGKSWPKINFIKALKILKNKFPEYYRKALKNWPKNNKIVLNYINKQLNKNKNINPKKFNIKEEILNLL